MALQAPEQKTSPRYNERRLADQMDARGLDAVVGLSPDSFYYLSGAYQYSAVTIRERLAIAVVPRTGDPFLVVCANEETNVRRYTSIPDMAVYTEFVDSPAEVLARELARRGFGQATIGIEKKYCTAHYFEQIQQGLPSARLVDADGALDYARMVKTDQEIELMRIAAVGTDKAIYTAMELAKPGDSELKLVQLMIHNLTEIGGGEFKNVSWGVGAGENVLTTHYTGGARLIQDGDQVRLNLRASWEGYYSHLYRNAWVGQISTRHADNYERLREVHYETIAMMRPGVRCCDVFNRIKERGAATGLSFKGPHVGHSTGILLHENPRLQPLETAELEAGMVIAVEPNALDPGFGVYHIEDLVVVTNGEPVNLSDYTDTTSPFIIR